MARGRDTEGRMDREQRGKDPKSLGQLQNFVLALSCILNCLSYEKKNILITLFPPHMVICLSYEKQKYFNKAFFPHIVICQRKLTRWRSDPKDSFCLLWILLGTQGLCVLSRFPWVVKTFRNKQLQGKSSGTQSGALLTIFPLAKEVTLPGLTPVS